MAARRLANGRPPMAKKSKPTISRKATGNMIRSHHRLHKQLVKAEAKGNDEEAGNLRKRINDLGGLESYQLASIQGQASDRGGDSSIVLMEWLQDIKPDLASSNPKLRMLEVGALSVDNACSKSALFEIERIDLKSQADGITKQDFMERPIPKFDKDQFDIISLSLVLNFVPDPEDRAKMLRQTCRFLDQRAPRTRPDSLQDRFPALFLVLPAACITNSRYMNEERLTLMMSSLGYVCLKRKQTARLIYWLWLLRDRPVPDEQNFPKKEVNPGKVRNNFLILLRKWRGDGGDNKGCLTS